MGTLERRPAGDSIIILGRQKAYDEPITGEDVFNGIAPDWSDPDNIVARLSRKRVPFVRNTLDPTSETAESESITGDNAAAPPIITSRSGAGDWEFEILPGDAINLLQGWFNTPTPANTALADQDIASKFEIDGNKIVPKAQDDNPLAAWPGMVELTLTGGSVTSVQLNGQQRRSRSNNFNGQTFETVAPDTNTFTSNKFYHQLNEIVMKGTAADSIASLKLKPDTKKAELTLPSLLSIFAGWSGQMIKAKSPFIAYNIVPNGFEFRVSAGSMRILLNVLASYVQEHRTLQSPIHIAYQLPEQNTATPKKRILEVYGYDNINFYPSYGTALAIGDVGQSLADLKAAVDAGTAHITPITDLSIVGSHNYTDPDGFTGDPVGGQPITEEGNTRTVNVNATVVHETDTSETDNQTAFWQDRYFEGQYVPIIVQNYNWDGLGRQSRIESQFVNCKLVEVPGLPIEGSGQVNRQLAFQAFPLGTDKEIKMIFHSKNGFAE